MSDYQTQLDELLASTVEAPAFDVEKASIDSIDQMIKAHQIKYISFYLEVRGEQELLTDNIADLGNVPEADRLEAFEHAS